MSTSSRGRRTYDVIVTREALGIQQKPKKRRQAYPRSRLLSVPILVGLVAVVLHLLTSPAYTVDSATVRGNTLIDAQTIYQTSMVEGQNLFLLKPQNAATAVARLPYVKQAWVHARPPNQVAIVVQEYRPRWMWITGNSRYWIDETGNILPDNGTLEGALTVVDSSQQPLPVGASLDSRVVQMLDALDRLLPDVRQVRYDASTGFILSVGPGWPARIGHSPQRLADKVGLLNALLPKLREQNQDVEFIDLRYAEQPYYRLK